MQFKGCCWHVQSGTAWRPSGQQAQEFSSSAQFLEWTTPEQSSFIEHNNLRFDGLSTALWLSAAIWENEPFSTPERSERVENWLFRATGEYTEAGIEQATVVMQCLGDNSPEPRRRAVPGWHVSAQKTSSYCNPANFRKRLIFVLFVSYWNLWKLIAYYPRSAGQ